MPLTFGGATTNNVLFTAGITMSADNRQLLVTMWVRPTTLTAGRYLFAAGAANNGAYLDAVTDELVLISNRTTDRTDVTTGVDLVVDEWRFLAFLVANENTGALDAWRVWAGGVTTPPVECTVTQVVAGSGNISAGSAFSIGNNVSGSVAWQGQIADVRYLNTSATPSATQHPLGLATSGAVTNDEAANIYQRFVLPAWRGDSWYGQLASAFACEVLWWSGEANATAIRYSPTIVASSSVAPSITGTTVSAENVPRALRNPLMPSVPW